MKRQFEKAVCAALFAMLPLAPAFAGAPVGFAGNASGEYLNSSCSGCGSADAWGLNGSGAFGFGMNNLAAQVDGGYHSVSSSGTDANLWNVGGSVFWAAGMGRIGANVSYETVDVSSVNGHVTSYGAFGEYYASDAFTLALRGGGLSVGGSVSGFGSASDTGSYVGAGVTGYLMTDLSLTGSVDYFDVGGGHLTSYGIGAEYLISESTPVAIYGGYNNVDISGSGSNVNQWIVGLKIYTDGNGSSLVDRQRNGAVGNAGPGAGLRSIF